jgi:hypothetical protein
MRSLKILFFVLLSLGLSAQCLPERHSTNWSDAWISCSPRPNPNPSRDSSHWILFDLNKHYRIHQVKCWNLNDPDRLDLGMREVSVDYSEDSLVWHTAGTIELERAPGNNRYEGAAWEDIPIPSARYVLLTALSTHGGRCGGLSEIRFAAEKLQDPVGVKEPQKANVFAVRISPNPFTDVAKIILEAPGTETVEYQVCDLLGQVIDRGSVYSDNGFHSLRLPTRHWKPGTYLFVASDGKRLVHQRLIKVNER